MNNFQRPGQNHILVFALEEPRYALPLSAVERIVYAVEITPVPKAPPSSLLCPAGWAPLAISFKNSAQPITRSVSSHFGQLEHLHFMKALYADQ